MYSQKADSSSVNSGCSGFEEKGPFYSREKLI
jgi:hypothetical protein